MPQNLFTAGDLPPGNPDLYAEESDRTFGYTVKFAVAGTVTGARVYGPTNTSPTTCRIKLFLKSSQALLAAKTFPSTITTGAWNSLDFDSAVSVTAGTEYVICYYMNGSGHYAETDGALSSDKVNGNITGVANEGRFKGASGLDDFPGSTFTGIFFVDPNFESSTPIAVGTAVEVDSALSVAPQFVIPVGTASEVDAALSVGVSMSVDVGTAVETDSALSVAATFVVPVGTAHETDSALSIGVEGGGVVASGNDLTLTYYANQLAGTLVNGVPTLTANAALVLWANENPDISVVEALNKEAGLSLPNWLALVGVLNDLANTTDLSAQAAAAELANP